MFQISFLYQLFVAMGLGSTIGLERELTGHSTGIRTCVLVCVGSCLFTSVPSYIPDGDVSRAAAQIITGVGFLGSGIIFKDGSNVRGLNTAATIWCTAAVGVFAGVALYLYALLATACLLIVNVIFRLLSPSGFAWSHYEDIGTVYQLFLICSTQEFPLVKDASLLILQKKQSHIFYVSSSKEADGADSLTIKFFHEGRPKEQFCESITKELMRYPSLRKIVWEETE